MKRILIALVALTTSTQLFAYGIGYSAYPLSQKMKLVTAEFAGLFSNDGGVGLQGRYTQKVTPRLIVDGGIGLGTGDRNRRAFAGADLELFPDYQKQPRVSAKAQLSRVEEFNIGRTYLGLAPTVSKGFAVYGHEVFPFFSVPVGLSLNTGKDQYETQISAALGATSNLPIEGYKHLKVNSELNIDIDNSYTGIFFGVSYPL